MQTDVRVGLQRTTQVFITHSANVFMADYPPLVHTTGREVSGEHLLKLEDEVCILFWHLSCILPVFSMFMSLFAKYMVA